MSMGSMSPSTTTGDGQGHVRISPDIDQVVTELAARFPAVPPEALRTVVTEEFGVFDGAAISTFVPVLVVKAATARLTRNGAPIILNTHTGLPGSGPPMLRCRPRSVNDDTRAVTAEPGATRPHFDPT